MPLSKMANLAIVAIAILLASTASQSRRIIREASADANATAIADILRKISSGQSDTEDDARLVDIIKGEITRTADEIKTPTGSIEAAARKAQLLVSELTAAYTSAIYESQTSEDGRESFARFQSTVQRIVDFIKNGQFLA